MPGQFYMLRCWGAAETPVLSRPISVHDVDEREGTLTFLYQIKGEGTQKLAHLAWGQTLTLTGPCGNGFDVAGGGGRRRARGRCGRRHRRGAAAAAVAGELAAAGCKPELYAGFRDAPYALEDFLPYCAAISVATDSGAVGYHGLVTGILHPEEFDLVLTCGPNVMMQGGLPPLRRKGRALPGQPGAQDGLRPGRLPGLHLPHESRPQKPSARTARYSPHRRCSTLAEFANVDLHVDLLGKRLAGPVIAASGTFGFGPEYGGHRGPDAARRHLRQGADAARPARQQRRAPVRDALRPDELHRPAEPRRSTTLSNTSCPP